MKVMTELNVLNISSDTVARGLSVREMFLMELRNLMKEKNK